jgi:hypothetical protein
MQESGYEVVWPLGKRVTENVALAPRIGDLSNKTVCELSHYGYRGEEIFPIIRATLSQRYAGIRFVGYNTFGNIHGTQEAEIVAGLANKLRQCGCEAVISGVGG